ncbi:MAG: Exostosin family [Bacteroidota bacterium]|jgi:hypothetical protein
MKKLPYKTNKTGSLFCEYYPEFFTLAKNDTETDIFFKNYNPILQKNLKPSPKTIYFFQYDKKSCPRQGIRTSDVVDQHYLQNVTFDGIIFAKTLDIFGPNIINNLIPHTPHLSISKNKDYFKEINNEEYKFYNKCFWRGGYTHVTRRKVLNFLNKKNDARFDVSHWTPKTGKIYDAESKSPDEWEYDEYFKNLSTSDIGLCIRGDRPWIFSFFDVIRSGAIPVCVNTQYHNLGWENIGYDINNLFLSYDLTKGDTLEDMYNGIDNLLKNKNKCLEMKKNLRKFYKEIYLTDRTHTFDNVKRYLTGFGDFFVAKVIEIIENNFVLKDNKFFCNKVFQIKNSAYAKD